MERRTKAWQRARLTPLAGKLPPEWEARYQALIAELGPQTDEPRIYSGWVGPSSPWSKEVIAAWSPIELAAQLRAWREPERGWDTPTPEGVGRMLTEVVAENPEPYANEAALLRGLSPTYVRAALQGFRDAAKAKRAFPWHPVLELCAWLETQRDAAPPDATGTGDEDPHWGWARREVASLLSTGFEGSVQIPIQERELVWDVLAPLTTDPEPSPDYEARYGGENMGPLNLSINTIRGEAMHAVVRYCLWTYRVLAERPDPAWRGFASVPEARAVLELHLDVASDPSLAIRAVYGQWLPWLALMDPHWVEQALPHLFPVASTLQSHRDAAWDTYVTMNRLYRNVFDLVRQEYERAVDDVGRTRPIETKLYEAPDHFLTQHVLVAYLLGWVDLSETGLAARLFTRAPEEHRVHAIEFVGRVLGEDNPPSDPAALARVPAFWDWVQTQRPRPKELEAFGWWYQAGRLEETWALGQLVSVLERTEGHIDMDHSVAEQLAASTGPLEDRLRAFDLMVQGAPSHSWEIGAWNEPLRAVLTTALADPTLAPRARALTGRVIAKGYPGFAELL